MNSVLSIILSFILSVFSFFPFFAPKDDPYENLKTVNLTSDGYSDFTVTDEDGNEVDESIFNCDGTEEVIPALPSSYDARESGLITPVKNQYSTGSCWAFGALSAAETSMIKKGLASSSVDYSEAHLTWFGLQTLTPNTADPTYGDGIYSQYPYSDGGNWARSVFTLARWAGAQKEQNAEFYNFPELMGNYPESDRYASYAHLQNSEYIDKTDLEGIKQAILDNGSITLSYYSSTSYYKTVNGSTCYYQKSVSNANHTVTAVGWDDSYPKENFKRTPATDGAWLVKNSWGTSWGDSGYFWLSYCDSSASCFITFDMESADNYDNINQYDGFGYKGWAYLSGCPQMSMANVFTAKNAEELKAVSFYTAQNEVDYILEIYTDVPEGANPTDGNLVLTQSGFLKNRCYHTEKLSESIILPKGMRYAAVITFTVQDGRDACIPIETPEGFDGAHERTYHAEPGQSYFTTERSFDLWLDSEDCGYHNVCIKTFTDNLELRTRELSPLRISGDYLFCVPVSYTESDILANLKNKNAVIRDGKAVLLDADGQTADIAYICAWGDIDSDGDVDYDDLSLQLLMVGGLIGYDEKMYMSANVSGDRRLSSLDISILSDYLDSQKKMV